MTPTLAELGGSGLKNTSLLRQQRVLVTGATGFVGQALVKGLTQDGYHVRAFQRSPLPTGPALWRSVELAQGDIGDVQAVSRALYGIDAVIHVAGALTGSAAQMWRSNALGSRQVAQAARAAGVKRFIHVSSAGVYGHSAGPAFREDSATQAADAYGYSKLEGERCVKEALAGSPTAWVVLRPFGVYGAARLEMFHEVQRRRLWLYGPTRAVVHPTHVDDVVGATLLALARAEQHGVRAEIFNVAGERALAHATLIRLIGVQLGLSPRVIEAPAWRVVSRAGDTTKARQRLGWQPRGLETALAATIHEARSAGHLS